jgi:hypothetical protein
VIARIIGLTSGAFIGGSIGGCDPKVKKWLGMGILSQAGVAIGLSLIVRNDFAAMASTRGLEIGAAVITTITATCIVFELIGPICTRFALDKAGEIPKKN